MKRTLLCAAFVIALSAPAFAFTSWQGDLFITSPNSAACAAVNMHQGDFARFVFRPKSAAGNTSPDALSFHFSRSSGQLVPAAQLGGATSATIRYIYGSGGFLQFTGNPISATVLPTPAPTTQQTLTMTITIQQFFRSATLSNCTVTFSGALTKRIN